MCSDITTILPLVEYSKRISLDRNNKSVITNPMVEVNRRTHDPELQLKHSDMEPTRRGQYSYS